MTYREVDSYAKGELRANFYGQRLKEAGEKQKRLETKKKIVKADEMPWEMSREGKLKHVVNEKMEDVRFDTLDVYIQEIPPGSRSGKHRHMSEETFYILEGKGYDIHQDPDVKIEDTYSWEPKKETKRFDWDQGDLVYIPPMVVHQHFNADAANRARIIVANIRLPMYMGCPIWEQLEDAPEYKK
jgi:quercetin dioxygenase-like cupin family protein